jgi:hypothetical protein
MRQTVAVQAETVDRLPYLVSIDRFWTLRLELIWQPSGCSLAGSADWEERRLLTTLMWHGVVWYITADVSEGTVTCRFTVKSYQFLISIRVRVVVKSRNFLDAALNRRVSCSVGKWKMSPQTCRLLFAVTFIPRCVGVRACWPAVQWHCATPCDVITHLLVWYEHQTDLF